MLEVSLVYTKSGEGEKENLVKASKLILGSQEKVLVLIWDSENVCVHRQWIQSYFRFHKNFVFTRESSTIDLGKTCLHQLVLNRLQIHR